MQTLLVQTKKYFTTTLTEAEVIVRDAKQEHGSLLKQHVITKKEKRTKEEVIEYFLVQITIEFYKAKDLI